MRKFLSLSLLAFVVSFLFVTSSFAQDDPETLVVTSVNTRGWTTAAPLADNRAGGSVDFVVDNSAPLGAGALSLTTDGSGLPGAGTAKAQYMHAADTALSDVTTLGYSTKTNSANFNNGAASYQLGLCLGGVVAGNCVGFTTMVYEPYNNGYNITMGQWAEYDVDAGTMWSSRDYSSGTCVVQRGFGGPPFYSLSTLKANCPVARVVAYGINVGSNNPNYNTETDKFVFQNTTYDFEKYNTPSNMEDCKKGGWTTFNPPTGPYKNQGQCVSSTVPQ